MWRTILTFGLIIGGVLILVQLNKFSLISGQLPGELLFGFLAAAFLGLGLFLGIRARRKPVQDEPVRTSPGLVPDPEAVQSTGLSPREMEVLQLLAQGHTNQKIADDLFVSLNTVKTHVSNIYLKLEVRNRTAAVARAREISLVD